MLFKDVMNNMFSFIWTQPIYKTLRQMRLIPVIMLVISTDIMYRLVGLLEEANGLSPEASLAAVGALIAAIFATIWKSIGDLNHPYKSDD